MEAVYHTQRGAPLAIGGIPDDDAQELRYALEIPYALSWLAKGDPHAEVEGLDRVPPELRPPTLVCHLAFQIMVLAGGALAVLGLLFAWLGWRRPESLDARWFLRLVALATPLGFIAVEAGWTVTEVGRQPWIIYGVMRTEEALSGMKGLVWPLLVTVSVYAILSVVVCAVLSRLVHATEHRLAHGREAGHG